MIIIVATGEKVKAPSIVSVQYHEIEIKVSTLERLELSLTLIFIWCLLSYIEQVVMDQVSPCNVVQT